MKRVFELINAVKQSYPNDCFFDGVHNSLKVSSQARAQYRAYESAFQYLDSESWKELKTKAIQHIQDHRQGQLKQGFFNQLNYAFAYQYIVRKGYQQVKILAETRRTTPDLSYQSN